MHAPKREPRYRNLTWMAAVAFALLAALAAPKAADSNWRALPLIHDGKIDENWIHVGYGGFVVEDGALRTDCDPKGLGLLVYKKEKLGDCQIRVVFKAKSAKCNSGVYVRIADGVLGQVSHPGAAFDRGTNGKISAASMKLAMESADRAEGAWYPVHHGYEVQIMDDNDPLHRTGAIYSLARSSARPGNTDDWRTMIITLVGERILVNVDGHRVTTFDPHSTDMLLDRKWFEPKREPERPQHGYIGLQNHDPGDVVWFREVSVRPLQSGAK